MTYSIIALDKRENMLGIATASGSIAVGSRVPWARYPIGGVVTQAYTNPALGLLILQLLEKGGDINEALEMALKIDKKPELRQVAVMDFKGNVAVHNGINIPKWNGYRILPYEAVCIANLVKGPEVCENAIEAFKKSTGWLGLRLLNALKEGHMAGGDHRGDRSSVLIIVGPTNYVPYYDYIINLRVDMSKNPIRDLDNILEEVINKNEYDKKYKRNIR